MILEKETYEEFGYYSFNLTPQSHKLLLAACDDCGKIRELRKCYYSDFCRSCVQKGEKNHLYGKHHSKKTKKKMSDAHKAEKNPNFGKHLSEAHKKKLSDANEGEKHPFYGKHHTKETKQKQRDAHKGKSFSEEHKRKLRETRKHQILPTHHTKPELMFEQICKKNNLPFKYVGDSSFWIGKNPAINPDFVESNGKKIAVEIFSYWHDPLRRHCKVPYSQTYEGRKKILKKYGWKLVVFWQEDLEREDAEAFVLSQLPFYVLTSKPYIYP